MKKTITFIIVALIFLVSIKANAQWVQMSNGMGSTQTVASIVATGNSIFAGTSNGIYISNNIGLSWLQSSLINKDIRSIAVKGNNIFAGTFAYSNPSGVYLSTNNGSTWNQTTLNDQAILCLAIAANNIFVGTMSGGIYLSTNDGVSWTHAGLENSTFSLAINGINIFAGTLSLGVYRSTNNGTNWTQTTLNNKDVRSLAVNGNYVFAGTSSGVYRSTNNGTNWTQTTLNNEIVLSIAVSENNIFAGTYSGVKLSTINGTSWFNKNQGFGVTPGVSSLFISNNYIYAGTIGQSVWRRSYTEIIGINQISTEVPSSYSLHQNYPNPFNPSTKIRYDLPKNGFVKLVVYDMLGKEIETLVNEKQSAGTYEATFNASQCPSGVYFYRLITDGFSETKRMLLVK